MSNDQGPRVVVETEFEDAPEGKTRASQASGNWWSTYTEEDYGRTGRQARSAVNGARRKATAFADGVMPGHGNAVVYGTLGFIAAILIFWLGFWQTIFIAFLVLVGVAFGQYLDGDPKIIRAFMRLIRSSDASFPRT